jgi:hypothetical protein
MLPVPSWKLIIEVYDPATFFHTLERVVAQVNLDIVARGDRPLILESTEASARTYHTLGREGAEGRVVITTEDGFLLVAPNRALIDESIRYRDAGVTLATSNAFQALLPDNGYTDCSALVYRDLGSLIDAVPPEMLGELEFADALSDDLSRGLVCVFGEPGRITASATGGSLVGLATTFGMCGAERAEKNLQPVREEDGAVSSL